MMYTFFFVCSGWSWQFLAERCGQVTQVPAICQVPLVSPAGHTGKKMKKSQTIAQHSRLMHFKTGVCMAFNARRVGEKVNCQVELCGEVCESSCVCVFCRN